MMILGKDAAVGAPREFVPATADFSVQEPSLMWWTAPAPGIEVP